MSAAIGRYRAKVDCRAGGLFRRAGEVFEMPMLNIVPGHLEKLSAQVGKAKGNLKPAGPATVPKSAQVGKSDIGAGEATPVQDVTSADVITK